MRRGHRKRRHFSIRSRAISSSISDLEHISSAGLGVLLKTHKQLAGRGSTLKLVRVTNHIADICKYPGFDRLFEIEMA